MRRIKKILIANRGEIALRIIQTAKKMNIATVAIYTSDDSNRQFVFEADEALLLEGDTLETTYLNADRIIEIALMLNADAIHPGYGFLSENADFAQKCIDNNLTWIGPSPASMQLMANKYKSSEFAKTLNIPVIESITGTNEELIKAATKLQYPLIIKAVSGGGGKGMRIARSKEDLPDMLDTVSKEALTYFNDGRLIISDYLEAVKHIEVQVLGDKHGNVVHLFERDCSVQRRNQKIIEEAPATGIPNSLKELLYNDALKLAKASDYYNAGTIEFLVDSNLNYYFLEMNTRIQVEHVVTEMITGIDIVGEQIKIAEGNKLLFSQKDIKISGHAIEFRICSEDALHNFIPSTGKISLLKVPQTKNLRIESDISGGIEINTNYDSLLSKIVVWGPTKENACASSLQILKEFILQGIETNIATHFEIIKHPAFLDSSYDTQFLSNNLDNLNKLNETARDAITALQLVHATVAAWLVNNYKTDIQNQNVWETIGFWRHLMTLEIVANNTSHHVEILNYTAKHIAIGYQDQLHTLKIQKCENNRIDYIVDGIRHTIYFSFNYEGGIHITIDGVNFYTEIKYHCFKQISETTLLKENSLKNWDETLILAPLPGKVLKIKVTEGDAILRGNTILIIESMKTENRVLAINNSKVVQIHIAEGEIIKRKQLLVTLEPITN